VGGGWGRKGEGGRNSNGANITKEGMQSNLLFMGHFDRRAKQLPRRGQIQNMLAELTT